MEPVFRLFIDEVGHASIKAAEHPNERYLSLTGIIMRIRHEAEFLTPQLDAIKNKIFGTTKIVLHRTEIVYRRDPFQCLEDAQLRAQFDEELLALLESCSYRVITVVIEMFQQRLSTKELKIRSKEANIAGLQLADLIASPSMRALICERDGNKMTAEFGIRVVEILKKNKYRRKYNGQISGVGTKWLP